MLTLKEAKLKAITRSIDASKPVKDYLRQFDHREILHSNDGKGSNPFGGALSE